MVYSIMDGKNEQITVILKGQSISNVQNYLVGLIIEADELVHTFFNKKKLSTSTVDNKGSKNDDGVYFSESVNKVTTPGRIHTPILSAESHSTIHSI